MLCEQYEVCSVHPTNLEYITFYYICWLCSNLMSSSATDFLTFIFRTLRAESSKLMNTSYNPSKKQNWDCLGVFSFLRNNFLSLRQLNLSPQQKESCLICQAKPNLLMASFCPTDTNDNSVLCRQKLSKPAFPGQAMLLYTVRTSLVPDPPWGLLKEKCRRKAGVHLETQLPHMERLFLHSHWAAEISTGAPFAL